MMRYLKQVKFQYEVSMDHILYEYLTSVIDFLRPHLLINGLKSNVFGNLEKKIHKCFNSEEMKKILLYSIVFLGGNPKNTPSIYSLMSHVDFNLGVWYPKGGIGSVVDALITIGEDYGVNYIYNQEVTGIKIESGTAKVVETKNSSYTADIVVVNADYQHAETTFFPDKISLTNKNFGIKRRLHLLHISSILVLTSLWRMSVFTR